MDDDELEIGLRGHYAAERHSPPPSPHVPDGRLARPDLLASEDRAHLAACSECRAALASGLRSAQAMPAAARTRRVTSRRWIPGLAAVACVAGLALLVVPPSDGLRSKGGTAMEAGVSLIATAVDGARRDLRDGAAVRVGDRIGFRFGAPAGLHSTLTILGYDGTQVKWYYPAAPGEEPYSVAAGQELVAARLPFDVELDASDRVGPLTIIAAFDVTPADLAAKVSRGEQPTGPSVHVFRLVVEGPAR